MNVPGRHNVSNALGVIALATEAGHSVRENRRRRWAVFSTRAGASRSNTRASVTCSSTITRIIPPRSARRSRPRKRPAATACSRCSSRTATRARRRCGRSLARAFDDADRVFVIRRLSRERGADSGCDREDDCRTRSRRTGTADGVYQPRLESSALRCREHHGAGRPGPEPRRRQHPRTTVLARGRSRDCRKAAGDRGRGRRSAPLRAARQTHHAARRRAGAVLGRAAQ